MDLRSLGMYRYHYPPRPQKYVDKGVTTRPKFRDDRAEEKEIHPYEHFTSLPTSQITEKSREALVKHKAVQCDIEGAEDVELLALPPFRYPKIVQQPGYIRLIVLLPALYFWSPIRCRLVYTSLRQNLRAEYIALSYTWNKDRDENDEDLYKPLPTIILNDCVLQVSENLLEALRRLRDKFESRVWWVDAICINQTDNSDRSFQVQQMREVYEKAKEVKVWLGEETELTEPAINFLHTLSDLDLSDLPSQPGYLTLNADDARACSDLLTKAWWTRVWIIQEIAVAKEVNMLCGGFIFPWTYLEKLSELLDKPYGYWYAAFQNVKGHDRARALVLERDEIQTGDPPSLLWSLASFRHFESSNPRDKLYSLLGISKQTYGLMPDYDKSVTEVYVSLVQEIIDQTGILDILAMATISLSIKAEEEEKLALPSWTPDWRFPNPLTELGSGQLYHASGNRKAEAEFSDSGKQLSLFGIQADTIEKCGESRPNGDLPPFAAWKSLAGANSRDSTYSAGGSRKAAYWRTVFADQMEFKRLPAEEPSLPLHFRGVSSERQDREIEASITYFTAPHCFGRNFFVTKRGYFGLGAPSIEPGDLVCVIPGGAVPFVLHETEGGYILQGESYVHKMMDGEIIETWVKDGGHDSELQAKTFTLV